MALKSLRETGIIIARCMVIYTSVDCYQIIGYPNNFKGKRKPLANHALYAIQEHISSITRYPPYMHTIEPQPPCINIQGIEATEWHMELDILEINLLGFYMV